MKRQARLKLIIGILMAATVAFFGLLFFVFDVNVILPLFIFLVYGTIIIYTIYTMEVWQTKDSSYVSERLDESVSEAMELANVGVLVYNEGYEIVYMSQLFIDRNLDRRHEKMFSWIPELETLLKSDRDMITVVLDEHKYEVTKKQDANVMLFRDITVEYDLRERYEEEIVVFGVVNFDNYDEVVEIDSDMTVITTDIKLPVYEYLKKNGVMYKTLRNNRLFLVLNERIYQNLVEDRFSIINTVRRESKRLDLPITLSMAFARGGDNFRELDEMVSNLIDLAQTRGGDQVVVRKKGEDALFFGGSSEAREKSSKVRVRVMANTIRDLIVRSSSVVIVGHNEMDADCVGSALCMSAIAQSYRKDTYIVGKTGGIEPMIANVLNRYKDEIDERHHFVTINEAANHIDDDALVIMVDHHSAAVSNGKDILAKAKRIVIVDHHRRKADLDVNPILVYVEASASSACELCCEFLPYLTKRVNISSTEANIMYLGILIDTNRFRVRTGARTFDVCRLLRQYGADPTLVEELNEEPYEMILKRSRLVNSSQLYREGVLISVDGDNEYPRSIISQACDTMLQTRNVRGVFVIAKLDSGENAISARSKNGFNVQMVLEKMHGGGHMTAAGLQTREYSVDELKSQLLKVIEEYVKNEE